MKMAYCCFSSSTFKKYAIFSFGVGCQQVTVSHTAKISAHTAEVGKLLWMAMKEQPLREENEEDDLLDSQNSRRKPQIAKV